ncbi:hypothetical protein CYY_000522 [Polysphondylium violaceum]|uniref:Splicing factor YJU2 n=1 Tax=Polysphondylium violaceum TaxID=133409 RepID=A0A8J4PZK4_9MYCE|nr:hypothetical protein CYY_000522 [Polysphondylium violaceum]
MSDRKVLTKYYPPEFDPSKITKIKVKKLPYTKVTTMLPMSIRCNTCGEYIGRGTKFNAKKETVAGESYLGLKIYRFYLRCKKCAAELTIRTDPKNSEYICEAGATKNYEPWKETQDEKDTRLHQEAEEEVDAMKALENRTLQSKREMEILDGLEEMKAHNSRLAEIADTDILLEYNLKKQQEIKDQFEKEDEDLIKQVFGKNKDHDSQDQDEDEDEEQDSEEDTKIKRIDDEQDDKFNSLFNSKSTNDNNSSVNNNSTKTTTTTASKPKTSILSNVKIVKSQEPPKPAPLAQPNTNLSSLLGGYDSDEEEEDN